MSAIAVPAPPAHRLAKADGLQHTDRDPAGDRGVVHRPLDRRPHSPAPDLVVLLDRVAGENDIAIMLGYILGVVGFLVGLGFANYPIKRLLGHPPSLAERESEEQGLFRYFTLSTDHKVVAKQYMVGIGVFFFVAGLNAMLIRTELLQPNVHVFGANQYLTLVGMHGSMMMGTMTSGLLGPFANSWCR